MMQPSVRMSSDDAVFLVVGERDAEAGLEIVGERDVGNDVEGGAAALARDVGDRATDELGM